MLEFFDKIFVINLQNYYLFLKFFFIYCYLKFFLNLLQLNKTIILYYFLLFLCLFIKKIKYYIN